MSIPTDDAARENSGGPRLTPKEQADILRILGFTIGIEGKRIEQYYPGLADACRRVYRLTIDAMRDAAKARGYCLAEHGSFSRDIDLVAIPWTENAASAEEVAEAIRAAAEKANPMHVAFANDADKPNPRPKPHGRLCWSFHLGGGPYIDLSVTPRIGGLDVR